MKLSIPSTTTKTNVIKLAMMRYGSSSSSSSSAATTMTTTSTTKTSTAASRLIQRRATTGSVSSIFYLKNLESSNPKQLKQAKFVENIFTFSVGVPIAILGLGGIYKISTATTSD
ncbi:hypothetical protein FRACYDRAFT_250253 [Fragilariopsis cylindrus CCMP1102]|uniref:Uncharacterized protein n=1 Tax=Fragilariopsis cylindrus CCMP1102 TaxID=635003 RepID=A0A1E7EPZ8_9STRA|nr:hypothetical protein FRACYDRAFT_250253 [Fragilariopsis cylindrus CCMP1102]|eukprot:OEU08032.1 hypothetical protein FRACYDRAFT_250253 [Fragilariopsis cylindrus CCMP1102]